MYLDDRLGGANDFQSAERASSYIRSSLSEFGFLITEEKCVWYPQQNMTWIGLVWDMEFGKLRVSSERIDRLVDVISKILFCVGKGKMLHNAKFVAGIVGQIISMQAVLGNLVRLRTRELYNCILLRASWKSLVALTAPAVEELRYWLNSVTQLNEQGNDLHESDVCDLVAFTDASEVGFGGYIVPAVDGICAESVCDSLEILTDCCLELPGNSLNTVVGSWTVLESGKSSTWRELEAVSRTVKSSLRCLENHCLKLNTDNKNVTSIVKNGSKKPELQNIACELNYLCSENNIKIKPHWIPREQNKIADGLSRYSDCDDWGIKESVFRMLDKLWGKHTIDRFATDYNTKCSRFNSKCWCKNTEAIDAFSQNWFGENNWLVPPPNVVCKVIRKLCSDEANCTLVVPLWYSSPYWLMLHDIFGNLKHFIKEKHQIMSISPVVPGRGNNGVFGKYMKFSLIAFKIRFN
ncbi:uncharacterized protein [Mytilus edulis]|uniref:uncharacterized protein n=1 Tax=Mytilus edulis TaxID=6550 RepID=UPI0039EE3E62